LSVFIDIIFVIIIAAIAVAMYIVGLFYLLNTQAVGFFGWEISMWQNPMSQENKVNTSTGYFQYTVSRFID
jgi:hypothetical protein